MPSLQHERQAKAAPAVSQASLDGSSARRVPARRGGGRPHLQAFTEVIELLVKQPRSITDICEVLDVESTGRRDVISDYVRVLRESGLVYITEWRKPLRRRSVDKPFVPCGALMPVYAWQPSVCAYVDAAKPELRAMGKSAHSTCDVARGLTSKAVGINE